MRRIRGERGAALVEAAVTIPLLLLIAVGILDFGRAYQTWQVLTNAAREGARYAVTPAGNVADTEKVVRDYMGGGALDPALIASSTVTVDRGVPLSTGSASTVTINYPFQFLVLQPVVKLVVGPSGSVREPWTMIVSTTMRNEAP